LLGGILIPFLVSFVDISLRSILQESLSPQPLTYLSFGALLLMYGVSYFYLWQHFIKRKGLELVKLLEFGTLIIIMSDLLMYASLYQASNIRSNFIWLGFYLLLIGLFYLLGKRSMKGVSKNP